MVNPPIKIKIEDDSIPVYVFADRNEYEAWLINKTETVPRWTFSNGGIYQITRIAYRPDDQVFVREYSTPQEHDDPYFNGYIAWGIYDRDSDGWIYPITIL